MATRRTVLVGALGLAGSGGLTALLSACGPGTPDDDASAGGGPVTSFSYGDDDIQVADLHLPAGNVTGMPVVVLVHGGYWSSSYDRTLEDAVAADLVDHGWAVWNVDYRSVGNGGGYPETFEDVAAACDLLAEVGPDHGLDTARVAVVGHSAGGTLALWAAGRHRLPAGVPGADPRLHPVAVVSQAGINDLVTGATDGLGGGAVAALLGVEPEDDPDDVYPVTSPTALLPLGLPTLAITGEDDTTVPPGQTTMYAQAATALGDPVQLQVVAGEGHFEHLDPTSEVWTVARDWLAVQVPPA